MSEYVRFRLSARQISIIWPGLDFLINSYNVRKKKKAALYACPFGLMHLPPSFDRGTYHSKSMDEIVAAWQHLRPKFAKGGRVQLNALQIRGCLVAVRVHLALRRREIFNAQRVLRRGPGKMSVEIEAKLRDAKIELEADRKALFHLKVRSKRVIRTLERHMKRANRLLRLSIPPYEYKSLTAAWKAHLRWIHLHLAYFQTVKVTTGRKKFQQQLLDTLVGMAERGLRNQGYHPPSMSELRRIMRLYAVSARRGRQGIWSIPFLVQNPKYFDGTWRLASFVMRRLNLEPLEEQ